MKYYNLSILYGGTCEQSLAVSPNFKNPSRIKLADAISIRSLILCVPSEMKACKLRVRPSWSHDSIGSSLNPSPFSGCFRGRTSPLSSFKIFVHEERTRIVV